MATAGENMEQTRADADAAAAAEKLDCQFHIYDDPARFPPRPNPAYPAIESATFTDAKIRIRISHALIAQLCQENGCIDELR